jgi:hypothetical protein
MNWKYLKCTKRQKNIKPIIKYEYFAEYFKNNFNLTFGTPKTDTCQTCDRFKNLINHKTVPKIKREFEIEKKCI